MAFQRSSAQLVVQLEQFLDLGCQCIQCLLRFAKQNAGLGVKAMAEAFNCLSVLIDWPCKHSDRCFVAVLPSTKLTLVSLLLVQGCNKQESGHADCYISLNLISLALAISTYCLSSLSTQPWNIARNIDKRWIFDEFLVSSVTALAKPSGSVSSIMMLQTGLMSLAISDDDGTERSFSDVTHF